MASCISGFKNVCQGAKAFASQLLPLQRPWHLQSKYQILSFKLPIFQTDILSSQYRPSLVSQPLVSPDNDTEYTRRWAAFCAASVEFLCNLYQLQCPEWVHDPRYILSQPWSGSNNFPDITPQRIKTTAIPYAKRNIFCGSGLFKNKYELFEWMLEARRQGITNPREIRNYAHQKEIGIHGI